ncbi:MAG: matrixin family metalloprotease [Nitrosotalea sp.]
MTQRMTDKEYSISQWRRQLEYLTNELNKTTEQIQLLEIFGNSKSEMVFEKPEHEISELMRKQNTISHEIITIKKRIQKLSAKTILKVELLILPVVVILLFFVATNYSIMPAEQGSTIKTHYVIEDLQGNSVGNYKHWSIISGTPLTVNIKNHANVSDQKIQDVENAIMSTDSITGDSSTLYQSASGMKSAYFKGWQGAVQTAYANTKYNIPEKFNIIQSDNSEGNIVVTLSTVKSEDGYSGVTRTIVNGNQILKTFITIFDSDKLTDSQLESTVRQEFGHALGLPYTDNPADLMHESISTTNSYISECDINALQKVYNDVDPAGNFCNG